MVDPVHDQCRGEHFAPSCFGFRIRSEYPFKFLRHGGGGETLEVVRAERPLTAPDDTLLFQWILPDPSADVSARLYGTNGIFHYWTTDAGWYRIDPTARRIEISDHADEIRREQRLWSIPTALCIKHRGDFVIHAAAIEIDGSAILLAAPRRFGKTTLAVAFHRNGYRLLTEDTACCGVTHGPVLFPGPASVRLRPDMFDGQAPSGTRVVAVRNDRIHLALSHDRTGDGRPVPIKALVFLRESPGEIFCKRVKSSTTLPDLWTLTFRFQDDNERRRSFSALARLAASVPVWNLHRPLKVDALDEVVSRLAEVVGSSAETL